MVGGGGTETLALDGCPRIKRLLVEHKVFQVPRTR